MPFRSLDHGAHLHLRTVFMGVIALVSSATHAFERDGNPFNADNWAISYAFDGLTSASTWLDWQNNQPVNVVYTYDWASGLWKRDGVPIQGAPALPFFNSTSTPMLMLAVHSEGNCKVLVDWIGIGVAPDKTRMFLSTRSEAESTIGGSLIVDDAMGDAPVPASFLDVPGFVSSGKHIRQFDVSNGHGEMAFHTLAEAVVTGETVRAYADARSLIGVIDIRSVDIGCSGSQANYGKVPDGIGTYAYLLRGTSQAVERQYNKFKAELNPVVHPNWATVSGRWDIGLPLTEQEFSFDGDTWTYSPKYLPPVTIEYIPYAAHDCIPHEHYAWLQGPSGDLPQGGSWIVPSMLRDYVAPVKLVTSVYLFPPPGYPHTDIYDNDAATVTTVGLDDSWSDGVSAEARREVHFHKQREKDQVLDYICDPRADLEWQVLPLNDMQNGWVAFDDGVSDITVQSHQVEAVAARVVQFAAAIGGVLSAIYDAPGTVAMLCALLNVEVSLPSFPDEVKQVLKIEYSAYTWRTEPLGDPRFPTQYPEFHWKVNYKPRTWVFPVVLDVWGANGYLGQEVEDRFEYSDQPTESARLYVFRHRIPLPQPNHGPEPQ